MSLLQPREKIKKSKQFFKNKQKHRHLDYDIDEINSQDIYMEEECESYMTLKELNTKLKQSNITNYVINIVNLTILYLFHHNKVNIYYYDNDMSIIKSSFSGGEGEGEDRNEQCVKFTVEIKNQYHIIDYNSMNVEINNEYIKIDYINYTCKIMFNDITNNSLIIRNECIINDKLTLMDDVGLEYITNEFSIRYLYINLTKSISNGKDLILSLIESTINRIKALNNDKINDEIIGGIMNSKILFTYDKTNDSTPVHYPRGDCVLNSLYICDKYISQNIVNFQFQYDDIITLKKDIYTYLIESSWTLNGISYMPIKNNLVVNPYIIQNLTYCDKYNNYYNNKILWDIEFYNTDVPNIPLETPHCIIGLINGNILKIIDTTYLNINIEFTIDDKNEHIFDIIFEPDKIIYKFDDNEINNNISRYLHLLYDDNIDYKIKYIKIINKNATISFNIKFRITDICSEDLISDSEDYINLSSSQTSQTYRSSLPPLSSLSSPQTPNPLFNPTSQTSRSSLPPLSSLSSPQTSNPLFNPTSQTFKPSYPPFSSFHGGNNNIMNYILYLILFIIIIIIIIILIIKYNKNNFYKNK